MWKSMRMCSAAKAERVSDRINKIDRIDKNSNFCLSGRKAEGFPFLRVAFSVSSLRGVGPNGPEAGS